MVQVTVAIEHHQLDAGGLRFLSDGVTHELGLLDLGDAFRLLVLQRGGAHQRAAGLIIDDLGVHARVAAVDRKTWAGRRTCQVLANPLLDLQSACGPIECHGVAYLPAALPALRRTTSPTKRTPLPL